MANFDKNNPEHRRKVLEIGIDRINSGEPASKVWQQVAGQVNLNRATLYRWFALVSGQPKARWLELLAPQNKGNRKRADFDPDVYALVVEKMKQGLTMMEAYRQSKSWAENEGKPCPSVTTIRRRLKEDGVPPPSRYRNL